MLTPVWGGTACRERGICTCQQLAAVCLLDGITPPFIEPWREEKVLPTGLPLATRRTTYAAIAGSRRCR